MSAESLVKMANNIESFFRSEPDRAAAIAGIEAHILRFWAPRMRKAIVDHLRCGGEGLGELAKLAVQRLGGR